MKEMLRRFVPYLSKTVTTSAEVEDPFKDSLNHTSDNDTVQDKCYIPFEI